MGLKATESLTSFTRSISSVCVCVCVFTFHWEGRHWLYLFGAAAWQPIPESGWWRDGGESRGKTQEKKTNMWRGCSLFSSWSVREKSTLFLHEKSKYVERRIEIISITGNLHEKRADPNVHHWHYQHDVQPDLHTCTQQQPHQAKEEPFHSRETSVTKSIS